MTNRMNDRSDVRVLVMEGIHNFRDYGGYAARGGRLKRGVLWRSGQHGDATPADLDVVHGLGIAKVIDLRGDSERAESPCLRHPQFDGEVLFHPGETASARGRAVHEEVADMVRTAQDARAAMVAVYAKLPFRPVLVGSYRLFMAALARDDAPSLLHCLAGKDRTGVGVAVVHGLMGVHHDDILEDYLLTNTAGDSEARIEAGARHLRKGGRALMDDAAMRVVMGVEPQFLDQAIAAIEQAHGGYEGYARDVLGVTPQMLAAMERNLIES